MFVSVRVGVFISRVSASLLYCHSRLLSKTPDSIFYFKNTSLSDIPYFHEFTQVGSMAEFGVKTVPMRSRRRPEMGPNVSPNQFYTERESNRYAVKPRNVQTQKDLIRMAFDLIYRTNGYQSNMFILDVGFGSGLHHAFSENFVLGTDINTIMLEKARNIEPPMDLIQADMKALQILRSGVFDAVTSISTLQWVLAQTDCDQSLAMRQTFQSIAHCLKSQAPAVLQFYPRRINDLYNIAEIVEGLDLFYGAIICGFPHGNKAKKLFLFLKKKQ